MKFQYGGLLLLAAAFACQPAQEQNSKEKIVDHAYDNRNLEPQGSYGVIETEYTVDARVDADVLARTVTDVHGKLYLPEGDGPFPVLAFLHGNHGTCGQEMGVDEKGEANPRLDISIEYTSTGKCTDGLVPSPSYLGYEYSAEHLASWGYAVISIDANRGITGTNGSSPDQLLIAARGKLVLKHLALLKSWSSSGDSSKLVNKSINLKNKFDFTEVGLMGHSRGGEGVRQAFDIYNKTSTWKQKIPELKVKGIFEIAPVDFGSTGAINAYGTAWAVLIGACDGDVTNFAGTNPYARMMSTQDGFPKAVFAVWGANHNFFNSEWQVSDSVHSCFGNQKPLWLPTKGPQPKQLPGSENLDPNALSGITGSKEQRTFGKSLMYAFFRANVGKNTDPSLMATFDPQYALPTEFDKIASSSRDIIRLSDSKLVAEPVTAYPQATTVGGLSLQSLSSKVKQEIPLLKSFWSSQRYSVDIATPSFPRDALLIKGTNLSRVEEITLSFGSSAVDSTGYWTIDTALARRTNCAPGATCTAETSVPSVDVAVVYEDGTASKFVKLSDYIKLDYYHDNFHLDYTEGRTQFYTYSPLLYSLARFELSDFALKSSKISGLRLRFAAGQSISLAVDDIRLVKHPGTL